MIHPPHITEKFWHELTVESGIKPELAKLNTKFIIGDDVYAALLYDLPQMARRNDRRLRDSYLNRYANVAASGGLWINSLDPDHDWEKLMEWGRLKPVVPRIDNKGGKIKYESPARPATNRVSFFRLDLETWRKIAKRYKTAMPERVVLTNDGEALGFWSWVQSNPQIPIILCEGEKKALCLLSLGYPAIAIPGLTASYCPTCGGWIVNRSKQQKGVGQ